MPKVAETARRVALFVEGDTERGTLSTFLHNWLDPLLPKDKKVGIHAVKFHGVSNYLDDLPQKLEMYIQQRRANCVIGLVDLYGLPPDRFDFKKCATVKDRIAVARKTILNLIPSHLGKVFSQHFSVHEVEAWLLAYPDRFPVDIRAQITKRNPEEVNGTEPPAKFLKRLMRGRYKKTVFAQNVFPYVDPRIAVSKCPNLSLLVNDLLAIARQLQVGSSPSKRG